jgi:redox-sensitive bicupin YhaK (pirin superfamily)
VKKLIQIIRSEERFRANHGWLDTRHSFSFANYYDPDNLHFGPLRVFNDDIVQPGQGFGRHPHADMEIMTYVIEGTLEHQDSMGNKEVLRAGEVQRITAGTGIYHSEYNHSDKELVHFLQIWFLPNEKGLKPSWDQKSFAKQQQENQLLPIVSGKPHEDALYINQDITVYLSQLEAGKELLHEQDDDRHMYLFVIKGDIKLNDNHSLAEGDTARISELTKLAISTDNGAEFMLMDLSVLEA